MFWYTPLTAVIVVHVSGAGVFCRRRSRSVLVAGLVLLSGWSDVSSGHSNECMDSASVWYRLGEDDYECGYAGGG